MDFLNGVANFTCLLKPKVCNDPIRWYADRPELSAYHYPLQLIS